MLADLGLTMVSFGSQDSTVGIVTGYRLDN
jgi:hypothetical protein